MVYMYKTRHFGTYYTWEHKKTIILRSLLIDLLHEIPLDFRVRCLVNAPPPLRAVMGLCNRILEKFQDNTDNKYVCR